MSEESIVRRSEQLAALATSLSRAQGEMENPTKDSTNPHYKSKYADLAGVINSVKAVLAKHGLSFSQHPSFKGNLVSVETMLLHISGQWISSIISAPVQKMDAPGVGSVITYCRRYSLCAVLGIAQEDDDSNASIGIYSSQKKAAPAEVNITEDAKPDWWIPYKMVERSSVLKSFSGIPIQQISLDDLHKISDISQGMLKEATTESGKKIAESVINSCMKEIMLRPEEGTV